MSSNAQEKQKIMAETAKKLLESGEVGYVIGWKATRFPEKTTAAFLRSAEEAANLVWNEYTVNGIAKYLLDDKYPDRRIGIFARGCDSKAINRLIADNQIKRENLYIIGVPCEGKDAKRCAACRQKNPMIYDELLWDPVPESEPLQERFDGVNEIEAMSADERYRYWSDVCSRCIRCYACRNACPVCSCRECYVDMSRTGFQGKAHSLSDNYIFGVTRAFHVGDRCIECGECERVCPMGLPIMGQTKKIIKDIVEMTGGYEAGMSMEEGNSYLGTFDLDDKDDFM